MRTLLVTGSSSGIGRAVTERLLADGHQVVGVARDLSKLGLMPPSFTGYAIELGGIDTVTGALSKLLAAHPDIDGAVLCAGQGLFGGLEQLAPEAIESFVDLSLTSTALQVRLLLPFLKRKRQGDLVFLGSEAALQGRKMGALYCATKFALRGMAQALREECAPAGVRVTLINPGMVKSPFFDSQAFEPGDAPENFILPADVAETVAFVLGSRPEIVLDEINLTPLKRVVRFKKKPTP